MGDKLIIVGNSALEFWRAEGQLRPQPNNTAHLVDARDAACTHDGIQAALIREPRVRLLHRPLHILVPNRLPRSTESQAVGHICSGPLPDGALISLGCDVYVLPPEATLAFMARYLPLHELTIRAFELCGTYRMSPNGHTLFDQEQLTTPRLVRDFLDACPPPRSGTMFGSPFRMRDALEYLLDGSASPRESALALYLTLPNKYGGMGFPRPQLNYEVIASNLSRDYDNR